MVSLPVRVAPLVAPPRALLERIQASIARERERRARERKSLRERDRERENTERKLESQKETKPKTLHSPEERIKE